jgi:trypsin-like peptidase
MVLALVFTDGSRHSVIGSAVMVAPCIALCATHTVHDFTADLRRGALTLAAMGISSHGAQVWDVLCVVSIERTDLSILTLRIQSEIPVNRTFYQATITTRLPPIGETVVFGGFRASREEFRLITERMLEIEGVMRLGSGVVRQSFPQGRDRLLVPWPSLEVDAPLFGGMSGGPVFDSRGGLIGLGSRSMEMGIGEEPSPMIVALLWPILGHSFPLASEPARSATLLDLHAVLTIIERPDAVHVTPSASGLMTTYTAWS